MFLLDTNVISELRKPQADPNVVAWARNVPAYRLYISAITLLEIETGILRLQRRGSRSGYTTARSQTQTVAFCAAIRTSDSQCSRPRYK